MRYAFVHTRKDKKLQVLTCSFYFMETLGQVSSGYIRSNQQTMNDETLIEHSVLRVVFAAILPMYGELRQGWQRKSFFSVSSGVPARARIGNR